MSSLEQHISTYLFNLLNSHGLGANRFKDWVMIENGFPAVRAFYTPPDKAGQSGRLDVQVLLAEGIVVEECFAAFGDSDTEAISGALAQFSASMFHPIIQACCGLENDDQVVSDYWKIGRFSRLKIWSGNIAMRLSEGVAVDVPDDWLKGVAGLAKTMSFRKGYNWASLYFARLDDDLPISDCRLINEPWPVADEMTKALDWPQASGFYGARMFVLMKR